MNAAIRTTATALRHLLMSGLLRPVGPVTAARMARAWRRYGRSPATLVAVSAARYPRRTAVIDERGSLTYRQLQQRCEAITAALAGRGRTPRSVAVLCRNHRSFIEGLVVAGQLGADTVLINTEMPAAQLNRILDQYSPDLLIADREYAAALADYSGRIVFDTARPTEHATRTLDWLAASGRGRRTRRVRGETTLTMLTSGTTGLAKSVSRAPLPAGTTGLGLSAMAAMRLRSGDVTLIATPFFHGFGLLSLLATLGTGSTVVCRKRFDARRTLHDIDAHRVSVLAGVPVMLQRLLAVGGSDLCTTTLRLAVTGGATVPAAVVAAFQHTFGPILVNGYGSTEAGVISLAEPNQLADNPATVGTPVLGLRLRILRTDRTDCEPGVVGTIFVRGGISYTGYVPDAAGTPAEEIVDGYLNTGDLGHLDEHGRLYIDGRADDMIISGGENIFPTEVTNALLTHPAVTDATVIGVPDDEYGQVLTAYLEQTPGSARPSPDELKLHLRTTLERYKVPKTFTWVDRIPRNATGKATLRGHTAGPEPGTRDPAFCRRGGQR
ncbi:AMP-binding protein [Nocardia arthritidis]|uniref:AMP-binding protein n=1 Tax=Nocardia arthritidis TaxID=228602 RepID=A0A6G9YB05_9NOCA|nr:AMP-binding protein [Nocardia arthritidis]QIS10445.1 AMP-binding protein [Nocardia arthritidis]